MGSRNAVLSTPRTLDISPPLAGWSNLEFPLDFQLLRGFVGFGTETANISIFAGLRGKQYLQYIVQYLQEMLAILNIHTCRDPNQSFRDPYAGGMEQQKGISRISSEH